MGALGGAFQPAAAAADFLGGVPRQQQRVDVVARVLHPVLTERHGALCQAHGGKAVVLGDHRITGVQEFHQPKVHAVRPLGEGPRTRARAFEYMGGVTEDLNMRVPAW